MCQSIQRRLTDTRTLLVASPLFVLERIDLLSKSNWELHAEHETWLFVLEGHAQIGLMNAFAGEAMFLDAERASVKVGVGGLKGLLAYVAAEPSSGLLYGCERQIGSSPEHHSFPPPV